MIKFQFLDVGQSETPSCGFVRVGLKGVKNNSEHHEVGVHSYLPNVHLNL